MAIRGDNRVRTRIRIIFNFRLKGYACWYECRTGRATGTTQGGFGCLILPFFFCTRVNLMNVLKFMLLYLYFINLL